MRLEAAQFLLALVVVGIGVGFGFGGWHGVSAVGALLALDHFADRWRVER